MYVVDFFGRLRFINDDDSTHHNPLAGGRPVQAAGQMTIQESGGQFTIKAGPNTESGHYYPYKGTEGIAKEILSNNGINLTIPSFNTRILESNEKK